MHSAQCTVHGALCTVHCALCIVDCAQAACTVSVHRPAGPVTPQKAGPRRRPQAGAGWAAVVGHRPQPLEGRAAGWMEGGRELPEGWRVAGRAVVAGEGCDGCEGWWQGRKRVGRAGRTWTREGDNPSTSSSGGQKDTSKLLSPRPCLAES